MVLRWLEGVSAHILARDCETVVFCLIIPVSLRAKRNCAIFGSVSALSEEDQNNSLPTQGRFPEIPGRQVSSFMGET